MFLSSVSKTPLVGLVNPATSAFQLWNCSKSVGTPEGDPVSLGVAGLTAFTMLSSTSFVVGDDEGGLHLYELRGEEGWTYADRIGNHRHGITALLLLADGRLVSGSSNGTVAFWDLKREAYHKCVFLIDDEYHEDPVVAFHQTSWRSSPAEAGEECRLYILGQQGVGTWDVSDGKEPTELMGYSGITSRATCLTVLPDGRIAIGTVDGGIDLLTEPGKESETSGWDLLDGHEGAVTAVYGLPDGSLVSFGADGALFLWDTETHQIVDALEELDSEGSTRMSPERVAYYTNEKLLCYEGLPS